MAKKTRAAAKVMTPRGDGANAIIPLTPQAYSISVNYGASQGIMRGTPADWFGPLNPMAPIAPREIAGRQLDFAPGYNLATTPRAYEPIGFPQLQAFAQVYDLLRLVIETRKDELERLRWSIRPRDKDRARQLRKAMSKDPKKGEPGGEVVDETAASDAARIEALVKFFKKPDGVTPWGTWLRMLLEDLLVIDAPTLYKQRTRGGRLYALLPLDGSTIKRVIDDWGRTPVPYIGADGVEVVPPAYQQVLKGLPAIDYSVRDLIYKPRNVRTGKIYGYSPVEQILMTVNIALRRQMWQLAYYTEGNIPEALIGVPENWTPQQIKDFQNYWDAHFTGDLAARRHAKFVPGAMAKNVSQTKDPELMNQFDEWLARVVCFAFSTSPQPFVNMMNRATAGTAQDTAEDTGLQPGKQWIKGLVDDILDTEFNSDDLEFMFEEEEEVDQEKQQKVLSGYQGDGALTLNQVRIKMGEEPYGPEFPAADIPMVKTASGYVPIDANTLDGKKEALDVLGPPPDAFGGSPNGGGGGPGGKKPAPGEDKAPDLKGDAEKLAKRARRRARRLAPIPFDREATRKARLAIRAVFFKAFQALAAKVAKQLRDEVRKADETDEEKADRLAEGFDLSTLQAVYEEVARQLGDLAADSVDRALEQMGMADGTGIFDVVSERAVTAARERAAELVTDITDSTRTMLRDLIVNGLSDNIGLEEIAASIVSSTGFSQERADLIARTEVADANSQAALEGYRGAAEAGVQVQKEWLLGPNPCEVCQENAEAGPIDLDDDFPSGDDAPPAHPNCECALMPVVTDAGEAQPGGNESETE